MNTLLDKLDKVLSPLADVLSNNKFLRSIADGLVTTMPLTMIAAVFSVLNSLPKILPFLPQWSDEVAAILLTPYNLMFGMLALIISFTVANRHAKNYDLDGVSCGIVSLVCFVMIASVYENMSFTANYFGYAGIFTAVLSALVCVELYHFFIKHNLRIKMPESVPPLVSNAFEAIIPLLLLVSIFLGSSILCVQLTGDLIPRLIQNIVTPAVTGADSVAYQMIYHFFMQLFFWLGMHGWAITAGFSMPISMALQAEQAAAFAAGALPAELPHITAGGINMVNFFYFVPIILIVFCKAKRNKAVGKMALIPSIFSISEPMTFGLPIVLNPILGIPFIIYQPIMALINFGAVQLGLLNRSAISGIQGVPQPFSAFVGSHGDVRVFLVFAVMLVVAIAIWYPFLMVWDRKCLREEAMASEQVEN